MGTYYRFIMPGAIEGIKRYARAGYARIAMLYYI
jgi:hypothetical protein